MTREMQSLIRSLKCHFWHHLFFAATVVTLLLHIIGVASVVVPSSSCYALDNSSHIVDFTDWIGYPFEYEAKDSDLVVRFCKDVESRSQMGYIDFGRFDTLNYFVAGSGRVNFVQGFYKGDLLNCERSYDKMGRTAQVNIICGNCPDFQCKGSLGCICNVTYESSCRVIVELALPCKKQGPRVFEGFTVGFHPRSWEVVQNGMTQLGFEKSHHEFSFSTEQMHLTLYATAIASLSELVQKSTVKVFPEKGLELRLSGSAVAGRAPTTLLPSTLVIEWKCVEAQNMPYEVEITIPIENYEPVQFTLTKMCEYRQNKGRDSTKGWAIFGMMSFVSTLCFALFCCGGFLYRKCQNQVYLCPPCMITSIHKFTRSLVACSMDWMLYPALQFYLPAYKLLLKYRTVTIEQNLITEVIHFLMNLLGETNLLIPRYLRDKLKQNMVQSENWKTLLYNSVFPLETANLQQFETKCWMAILILRHGIVCSNIFV